MHSITAPGPLVPLLRMLLSTGIFGLQACRCLSVPRQPLALEASSEPWDKAAEVGRKVLMGPVGPGLT